MGHLAAHQQLRTLPLAPHHGRPAADLGHEREDHSEARGTPLCTCAPYCDRAVRLHSGSDLRGGGGLGVEVHCREVGLEDPSIIVEPAKDKDSKLKEENAKLRAALNEANKQLVLCGCEICKPPAEVCTPCS